MSPAIASFSKLSRSMTWHQWHAEYPIERKIGLSAALAAARASGPQGCQATGLCACCRRYGLVSPASRFAGRAWGADIREAQELSLIHISEPTRLLSISYAVFCLKKK